LKLKLIENGSLYIVMDYCEGGDLHSRLKTVETFLNENKILDWFTQIAEALKYIHNHKILHRDLKTQNIFLSKKDVIKVGDFGVCKRLDSTCELAQTKIGTPYYMSPEIYKNEPYNNKCDIWSLGCILYEMMTLKNPFQSAKTLPNLINMIINENYKEISKTKGYSMNLRNLVSLMIKLDPNERPSVDEILNISFIKEYLENKNNIYDNNSSKRMSNRHRSFTPSPTRLSSLQKCSPPMSPSIKKPVVIKRRRSERDITNYSKQLWKDDISNNQNEAIKIEIKIFKNNNHRIRIKSSQISMIASNGTPVKITPKMKIKKKMMMKSNSEIDINKLIAPIGNNNDKEIKFKNSLDSSIDLDDDLNNLNLN
jgi:serine/threonine protein kinase